MKKRNERNVNELVKTLPLQSRTDDILSDVLGSYTGSAMDGSRPIQDADDL